MQKNPDQTALRDKKFIGLQSVHTNGKLTGKREMVKNFNCQLRNEVCVCFFFFTSEGLKKSLFFNNMYFLAHI